MSVGGGLRYPGATVEEPPIFTLYGDGLVIYAAPAPPQRDLAARYDLHQARLDDAQIAALVEFALDDAGLAAARDYYGEVPIADDVTTTFEIQGAGFDKTVAVYALGYSGDGTPDLGARGRFQSLADQLRGFKALVESGEAIGLGAFEPEAYRVTLDQPFGPDAEPRDWPWPDLMLGDFKPTQGGWQTAVVSPDQAKTLADPVNSAPDNLVVRAPDSENYLVRIRPLLPDEVP